LQLADNLAGIGYDVQVWAQLESQLAIVCASVPAAITFTQCKNKNENCTWRSWRSRSSGLTFVIGATEGSGQNEVSERRDLSELEKV
jgi:hypothetical protein